MRPKKEVAVKNYIKGEKCSHRTYDNVTIGDARCHNCIMLISLTSDTIRCKSYGKDLEK